MPFPAYLQHFTDRQDQIAAFDALWPGDGRWILAYSGVSGNGKSTLVNWLIEERCKPNGWQWEKADFAINLPVEAVPRALATLAGSDALVHFEQAAAHACERYDAAMAEINRARAERALALTLTQTASSGGQISASPPRLDAQSADELRQLYTPLQERLEADLAHAALDAVAHLGDRRVVLFLDTYERFAEANPQPIVDRLWLLLQAAHERVPCLRIVVGGRQELPYPPLRDVTCWEPLHEFTSDDCDRFLRDFGMADAALRRATFDLFKGHPLTTRMMAEAYADALKRGQPITREALASVTLAQAQEWLYGQVIKYLTEPLKRPAKYGPLLRRFSHASLNEILQTELGDADFHLLVTRAFIKPLSGGLYAFHEVVRRVQIDYLAGSGDAQAETVHHRAVLGAQARLDSRRDLTAGQDVLYHRCFTDPSSQFDEWLATVDRAAFFFDHLWWNELLDVMQVSAIHQRLNARQHATVAFRRGRWHYYHDGWNDALAAYAQALPLYQAAQDVSGEANVLKAQGDVLAFLKRNDEALTRYEARWRCSSKSGPGWARPMCC